MRGPPIKRNRLTRIDELCAVAALMVCLFHFTRTMQDSIFQKLGDWGWMGVEIFFIISGFILPHSINLKKRQNNFNSIHFLKSRGKRLLPAFWLSCLLCILLWQISTLHPSFQGMTVPHNFGWYISNLTLTAELAEQEWINPVYWSLAIEAQFYLFLAICSRFLNPARHSIHYIWLPIILASSWFLTNPTLLTAWLPVFALGFISFWKWNNQFSRIELLSWRVILTLSIGLQRDWSVALVCFSASWLLDQPQKKSLSGLASIGIISYSLYLVHVPVGGKVINLCLRLNPQTEWAVLAILAGAFVVTFTTTWIFYRFCEKPFLNTAKSIQT